MVKHIILWRLRSELSESEKIEVKKNAKAALEELALKVPGLLFVKVNIEGLQSSNADMMLDTTLESEDALKAYQSHPDHVYVANTFVRPFTETRMCLDYEE